MTDFEIVQAMNQYGGGFIRSLANAWGHADAQNKERLKVAFPEYWQQYADIAEKRAGNQVSQ